MAGKIIVIEGLDGCGKSTQLELLKKKLPQCRFVSFPEYDSDAGRIITSYLHGEFPEENPLVSAYSASSFYAVDRYISCKRDEWYGAYLDGATIIAARYTTSNAIYQLAKLDKALWSGFLEWLSDYEYVKLGIPEPSKVIYLDVPVEVSQAMLSKRYDADESKKDIHEANASFMKRCYEAAHFSASYGKNKWELISCCENGGMRSIEEINRDILTAAEIAL